MNTEHIFPNKILLDISTEELAAELARRRGDEAPTDMFEAERLLGKRHGQDQDAAFAAYLLRLSRAETDNSKRCPRCGTLCRVRARARKRHIRTTTGAHVLERNQHYCEACKQGFYPLDCELGLSDEGEASPDLERRLLDFGLTSTFKEEEERWSVHYNNAISENFVRCVVERSQQIITTTKVKDVQEVIREESSKPSELLVIQTDGGMLPIRGEDWKESKLGVIYREENHAASSETVRGCITEARYVGHLGSIDRFKEHMSAALKVERVREAEQVVWLGDGAPWNWNMADELCPWAVQILDAMHATSHAIDCAKVLFGEKDEGLIIQWANRIKYLFYNATPQKLLDELGACRFGASPDELEALNALLNYYKNNQSRIQYSKFIELGFPIGSGTVESAHKHVLQKRMKLAGQYWNLRRAQGMVELRAAYRTTGPRRFYKAIRNLGQRRVEFGKRAV